MFENFHYVREAVDDEGRDHVLIFKAKVGGKEIDGCDFLHFYENGRVNNFMIMARPLSVAQALSKTMGTQFERFQREAVDG